MSEITFEREVLDRLTKIEVKLDSFDADPNKWLARTVVAAIITAVVGVVFVLIRMGAGI